MATAKALALLLRGIGILLMLAAFAVLMPFSWMERIHHALGLGELPDVPIVHYLTRSVSAVYVTWGALYFYLSLEVRRDAGLIRFVMLTKAALGATLIIIDVIVGMPWYWTVGEGPPILTVAVVIWWLAYRLEHQSGSTA